ncbi:MAG: alpha/beta hydrolase [Candidatus Lokiarchaeota archaeon]|nr:alpha/beta hydrolase [Candidatus Lokiarchaeota archaeon]
MANIIFIHGLESSGSGFKARFLKKQIPEIMTPDFEPYNSEISIDLILKKRMKQLESFLNENSSWIIIGSSFGGLMGTIYALQKPKNVYKLILLAPFLIETYFNNIKVKPLNIPVIIFHGKNDNVVNHNKTKWIAQKCFNNLQYHLVNDDHFLHSTVQSLNWKELIL